MCVTDVQLKGRGRSKNVWESPKGCLLFSFTIQMEDGRVVPLVQYVVSLAMTEAVNDVCRRNRLGYAANQLQREDIISAFFNKFEVFHDIFLSQDFQALENLYYKTWLHRGQRVVVQEKNESEDQVSENVVTIQGLTRSGYLLAATDDGQICELHPDGNSFDFFQGLVRRKLG
ncbi:biotin--protein ligase 1, chloroplastic-like isoform X2 [Salvia hispanica]|nr:biotin--protein ligase 1, chloroplastic-like isoform X2 [Salvia hispanica]